MLEGGSYVMKEYYWPALGSAFLTHSLVISAFAFNFPYMGKGQPQSLQNNFCVEMVFCNAQPKDHLSAIIPEKIHKLASSQGSSSGENKLKTQAQERIYDNPPRGKSSAKKGNEDKQFLKTVAVSTKGLDTSHNAISFFQPPPIYPREARLRKIQGIVMIQVHLSQEGAVSDARTIPPLVDPILENAALNAIRQWKFMPGVKTLEVPIEFKLEA
ncbi:MAG: energy transducer TonB [Alphaproteobacteria bacterium]|nr:energy transducer TonB [Alphaproteobacteria bacterium]